jgi:hypothetical protein
MLIRRREERYYRTGYVFWLLPMLIRVGRKGILGMTMCSSFCPCYSERGEERYYRTGYVF